MIELKVIRKNIKKVEKELERVAYDGHNFKAGLNIIKKLQFDRADDLTSCVQVIGKANDFYFLSGFLTGMERAIKERLWNEKN